MALPFPAFPASPAATGVSSSAAAGAADWVPWLMMFIPSSTGADDWVPYYNQNNSNTAKQCPPISPSDITDKTRDEIRDLAKQKGLVPAGDKTDPEYPRKWRDPVSGKERLRLDKGHKDPKTGQPYNDPRAAVDHVHGYDPAGGKIRDPIDGNAHFPTR